MLRELRPNTAPFFFSEVGLRIFVLASELFIPRPYFIRHLTAPKDAQRYCGFLFNLFFKEGSPKLKLNRKI